MQLGKQIRIPTPDDLLLDTMIVDLTFAIAHDGARRRSGRCLAQGGNGAKSSIIPVASQVRRNSSDGSAT